MGCQPLAYSLNLVEILFGTLLLHHSYLTLKRVTYILS